MTRAAARRRAAIVISIGVQAALIAAILAVPALRSTHHAQAARAVPAPVPTVAAQPAPATTTYPMRLALRVMIDGADNAVDLPSRRAGTLPIRLNFSPPGQPARVVVMFGNPGQLNPGQAPVTNVWFAIAPASAFDHQLPSLGASQGSMIRLKSTARQWSPGVSWFLFTIPAADLQPSSYPIVVMGAQEGSHQVTYGIAQLHVP
jgi:hypothetical protein